MLHDIDPRVFNNQYSNHQASDGDIFLSYRNDKVLVKEEEDKLWYPSFSDFAELSPSLSENAKYLFTVDSIRFFLVDPVEEKLESGWRYTPTARFRTEEKFWRSFAGAVGAELNRWYSTHRFCGACGERLDHSKKERMLSCPVCSTMYYPQICPSVIVGIYDGDRLLLTKYRGRAFKNYSLVAGYVEIGESLEQAVHREVEEEVGLKIHNVQFYKSQPWPFTDTLLAGFFAELDGDPTITLQEDELSVGEWIHRDDLPAQTLPISLTGEMIEAFRRRLPLQSNGKAT